MSTDDVDRTHILARLLEGHYALAALDPGAKCACGVRLTHDVVGSHCRHVAEVLMALGAAGE